MTYRNWNKSNNMIDYKKFNQSQINGEKRKKKTAVKHKIGASLVAQLVKESACNARDPSWFLGWEDPLEKGTATHSSILAWRIPWIV